MIHVHVKGGLWHYFWSVEVVDALIFLTKSVSYEHEVKGEKLWLYVPKWQV